MTKTITKSSTTDNLTSNLLKQLNLSSFETHLENIDHIATKNDWSYELFLRELCLIELDNRAERKTSRLIRQAKIPPKYTIENLNQKLLSAKIRKTLSVLLKGEFVSTGGNVLVFGLPGRGKSHLLGALARELILNHGVSVYFTPTFKIVESLLIAKKNLELEKALKKLDKFDVLILDDIGYVQQSKDEMEVLFTLLSDRYERKSIMLSSNLVFSKWDQIFKDKMTTMAAIDRLIHHATIIEYTGESIRASEAKAKLPKESLII
jgi:DNA replication protein DnaC